MSYEAFVYEWTNKLTNKKYIGSHVGTVDDGYICGNYIVKQIIKSDIQYFERTIIAYGTADDMRQYEYDLINQRNAVKDPNYYNNRNIKYNQIWSEERKAKCSNKGEAHPWYGKKRPEHSKHMSEYMKGENNPMYGKSHSEETKAKIGAANKGRKITHPKVICPHCSKEGIKGTMIRWHFDNCKHK